MKIEYDPIRDLLYVYFDVPGKKIAETVAIASGVHADFSADFSSILVTGMSRFMCISNGMIKLRKFGLTRYGYTAAVASIEQRYQRSLKLLKINEKL